MSIQLYSCITWMLCLEENLNGNYTRLLHVVLNKSYKRNTMKQLSKYIEQNLLDT